MAARRGKNQARRNSGGTPGWVWLVAGVALGLALFLAMPSLLRQDGDGFARFGPRPNPDARPAPISETDAIDNGAPSAAAPEPAPDAGARTAPAEETQYDFYTLLPGKEERLSDAELAARARAEAARQPQQQTPPTAGAELPPPLTETPAAPATSAPATAPGTQTANASADASARYLLQAGAFAASGDAEATKAKIALLGLSARVESARIGGNTVYRVRMGPYGSASELAEAKRKLADSGLPAMAIKVQ